MDKQELAEFIEWYWKNVQDKPCDIRSNELAQTYLDEK